jgi:hypothetical protein
VVSDGNLGGYVMDLAESDPDALSSSLVLQTEKVQILDEKGRPKKDDKGEDVPPVWLPTKLHASDVVDTGDAVDGFLSAPGAVSHTPVRFTGRAASDPATQRARGQARSHGQCHRTTRPGGAAPTVQTGLTKRQTCS